MIYWRATDETKVQLATVAGHGPDPCIGLLRQPYIRNLVEDGKRALLTQLEKRKTGLLLISHQNIDLRNSPLKDYKLYEGLNELCKEYSPLKQ